MNLLVMSSLQEQALDIHLCEPVQNKTFVTNEDYVPKLSTPWQLPGRRRWFRKARTPEGSYAPRVHVSCFGRSRVGAPVATAVVLGLMVGCRRARVKGAKRCQAVGGGVGGEGRVKGARRWALRRASGHLSTIGILLGFSFQASLCWTRRPAWRCSQLGSRRRIRGLTTSHRDA